MFLLALCLFIIGVCIGSFLNVLIDRLPNNENPLTGRSYCDKCRKTLKWYDLIPILSFVLLQGKCRSCKTKISFYYPLVEFITGLSFVGTFVFVYGLYGVGYNFQFLSFLYYPFIISILIVIFFADIKYGIIPDAVVYPAIVTTLMYQFLFAGQASIFNPLLSGTAAFIFFLFLFLITRGKGMGFGDVKLSLLIGLFLGYPLTLSAFYIAFLTGAIIGLILIICRKKLLMGGTIPFGPFLVFGTLISFYFGETIIRLGSRWLSLY